MLCARCWRKMVQAAIPARFIAVCGLLFAAQVIPVFSAGLLPVIARVGPWPVASRPVVFQGRLWFVNSVTGRDHNSAEIYSLDVKAGTVRHERHLWSQNAGRPMVAGGLLYWPSEDDRLFGNWGSFQVTNGRGWATGIIALKHIFHIHAMAERSGALYASVSAFRAGVMVSRDKGRSWQIVYRHPRKANQISRLLSLGVTPQRITGMLRERSGYRPVIVADGKLRPLPGWPVSARPANVATSRGYIFALAGGRLWRSDGTSSQMVHAFAGPRTPFGLHAGRGRLWLIRHTDGGSDILASRDGVRWQAVYHVPGGRAVEVLAGDRFIAVTGRGDDGRAIVWGKAEAPLPGGEQAVAALPRLGPGHQRAGRVDWAARSAGLNRVLADPASYEKVGRAVRSLVFAIAAEGPPKGFFARHLKARRAHGPMHLFADVDIADKAGLGTFWLLWGLGLARNGQVPVEYIARPWRVKRNRAEKYFAPQPVAMWAAGRTGQSDRRTLDALVARLFSASDPMWLRMDAAGALEAITGRHFGADFAAWRAYVNKTAGQRPDGQ